MKFDKTTPEIMSATTNPMCASGKWVAFSEKAEQIESEKRILENILDIGYWQAFQQFWFVQFCFSNQSIRENGIENDCPEIESDPGLGRAFLRESRLTMNQRITKGWMRPQMYDRILF